jgi:pimeloyl-ACP methyl ester carboxylesterase
MNSLRCRWGFRIAVTLFGAIAFPGLVTSTLLATPPELLESASRSERERIQARTLSISLEDDLFGTYPGAQYSASRIPGARFVGFPSGGHVWVGHHSEILAAIADLLHELPPPGCISTGTDRLQPQRVADHRY